MAKKNRDSEHIVWLVITLDFHESAELEVEGKIGGLTCGNLLNTRQPSTCLRNKAELFVALFTNIHPSAIKQN